MFSTSVQDTTLAYYSYKACMWITYFKLDCGTTVRERRQMTQRNELFSSHFWQTKHCSNNYSTLLCTLANTTVIELEKGAGKKKKRNKSPLIFSPSLKADTSFGS